MLRYVARAKACRPSKERVVRFAGTKQRTACAHRGGYVYLVRKPAACKRRQHRPSLVLTLPDNVRQSFCAHKRTGRMRSTRHAPYPDPRRPRLRATTCKRNERRVFVAQANRRPDAQDDLAAVGEDTANAVELQVLQNDTDPDGDELEVLGVDAPAARGAISVAPDRQSVAYAPNGRFEALGAGARAVETFHYEATDGRLSDAATVTVTVLGANDAPAAGADTGSTDEATVTTIAVLANDGDPDQGDVLTVTAVDTAGTTGAVTIGPDGAVRYDPAGRFDGLASGAQRVDSFGYTISDGHGGGASATVAVTVTGLGAPPTINTTGGALACTEDDPATPVDAGLTVSDADDTQLTGARVRLSAGFEAGDELLFTDQLGISGSYDAGTGVLTLTGAASVADYQTALRTVAYRHTGEDPAAAKTVEFRAGDGDGLGPGATRDIAMTAVNDAPTVTTSAGSASFTEGGGAVAVDSGLTVADPDSALLSGATVQIAAGFNGAQDVLGFVDQNGIVGSYDAATGVLTLSGSATVSSYQTALRSVTYDNGSGSPTTTTRTVQFRVTDAAAAVSAAAGRDVTVADSNSAPTVTTTAGATSYTEGDPATVVDGGLAVADTDDVDLEGATIRIAAGFAAGDALEFVNQLGISGVYDAGAGVLTLTGTASVASYQTALRSVAYGHTGDDPAATRTIEFRATDGDVLGPAATRDITITPTDDPPVAVDDDATVAEDSAAAAIGVLANDTDVDGGAKAIASVTDPANGAVVLTGGTPGAHTGLTYAPDANYCNDPPGTTPDTFTYTLNGGSTATVSVTVTCVDDPPTAVDDAPTVAEDSGASAFDVLANDTDDGGAMAIASVTDPANGAVVLTGGTPGAHTGLTYAPDANYCNDPPGTTPDTFTYTLNGGATATVSVTVTCVDDPPTAVDDATTVEEDAGATAVGVLANDTDSDGGPRSIASATDPANGAVVLTGGTPGAHTGLTYAPDANYCNDPPGTTPDTFTYTLNGGSTATVSVTVTCVDDPPVADDETFAAASGAIGNTTLIVNDPDDGAPTQSQPQKTVSGDILAGDVDVDGPGPLTVTPGTFATNDGGSVTVESDGDFTFQPAAATSCADAEDFFDYTLESGGSPALTDTGRVTIEIAGCAWYVSNNAAGNAGTSVAPFDTLAQAEAASGAGHTVFVFDGDNTSAGLGGDGYAMDPGERLIGEHEGLQVDPDGGGSLGTETLHPANPGAHPTLTASNADVIDLDDGNEVRGLTIDPAGAGGGIAGGAGDTGGGTIDDVNIVDSGTVANQPGLELAGTAGTFAITNLVVTNNATGVLLSGGTADFGSTTITSTGAPALSATGTNLSTSQFDSITSTGSTAGGVNLDGTTGATVLGDGTGVDLSLTTTSGSQPAFRLSSAGTVQVGAAGTDNVSATGGPAIDVTGTSGATLAFDDVDSLNSAGDGINLAGLGSGTFTANSASTITNAAGIDVDLDGGSGAVTYAGSISDDVGQLVRVANTTGGTKDFDGAITDLGDGDGSGIALTGNTGATIRFDGGLTLATGANPAFAATGGGTVAVTDPAGAASNTIATTTGTALQVANTSIHADRATFERIASNGAPNGIVLTNTGASGGLTVTGAGGTCSSAGSCTGGAIQNSTGPGVLLTSAGGGVDLTRMSINNGGDDGIRGAGVAGFNLANSMITSNGNAVGESGIELAQLTGSGSIAATTVSGSADRNAHIANTSGTLTAFNVTGSAFTTTSAVTGDDGFLVENNGTGPMTVSVTGSTFTDNKGDHFNAATSASATGSVALTFTGNTLETTPANDPNVIGGGITLAPSGSADMTFTVSNNTVQQAFDEAINLNLGTAATAAASMIGTISGNVVGTAGAVDSGSESGTGINVTSNGAGLTTVAVTGNQVFQYANPYGILLNHKEGSSTMNATVTGNTVANPGTFAINGVRVDSGATAGDSGVMCVGLTGNTLAGSGPGVDPDIRLRQRFNTTVRLPGYGGAAGDTTAVNAFVAGNNPGADVTSVHNFGAGGGGFVGGAACPTP